MNVRIEIFVVAMLDAQTTKEAMNVIASLVTKRSRTRLPANASTSTSAKNSIRHAVRMQSVSMLKDTTSVSAKKASWEMLHLDANVSNCFE